MARVNDLGGFISGEEGLTQAVWPDLATFRQFGKILKVLGNFSRVYLLLGKILSLL